MLLNKQLLRRQHKMVRKSGTYISHVTNLS